MNCPNCNTPVESDASFCGNCGQALGQKPPEIGVPAYAKSNDYQHRGEIKALASVLLGIFGIAGSLFMAFIGLIFGIAGLVMSTMSRRSVSRKLSSIGMVASSLAVVAGVSVWVYAYSHKTLDKKTPLDTKSTVTDTQIGTNLSTPCYSIGFVNKLSITHVQNSCDMKAFDGSTLESSTIAFKVYASKSDVTTTNAFNILVQKAIKKDVKKTLPSFEIDHEEATIFAGSPAYAVYVSNKSANVSLVEAAVYHKVPTGDNLFILVHAVNKNKVDLQLMESGWQWK